MLSIRTQDRMALVPYDGLTIREYDKNMIIRNFDKSIEEEIEVQICSTRHEWFIVYGTYATKERALEILDEIEKHTLGKVLTPIVYRMPSE